MCANVRVLVARGYVCGIYCINAPRFAGKEPQPIAEPVLPQRTIVSRVVRTSHVFFYIANTPIAVVYHLIRF